MESPIHVLLADDNAHIRQGIRKLLQQTPDIQVVGEARDGVQTIEMIQQLKPDIAIVDISMPQLDGIEVAERIFTRNIPAHILILSGYASKDFAKLAVNFHVDGYLMKEEAPDRLVDVIRRIMLGERRIFSEMALPIPTSQR